MLRKQIIILLISLALAGTAWADINSDLIDAAKEGQTFYVRELLKRGANVNTKEQQEGGTPLMVAAVYGATDTITLLLNNGAEINATSNENYTALMLAAMKGHVAAVKLLLSRGADIDIEKNGGITALMLAAENKHPKIVKILSEEKEQKKQIALPKTGDGLGKSRAELLKPFIEANFVFQIEYTLADGNPIVTYKAPNKICTLDLIGPKQNLKEASLMIGIPNDSPQLVFENTIYLAGFITQFVPKIDLKEFTNWFATAIEKNKKAERKEGAFRIQVTPFVKPSGVHTLSVSSAN